MVGQRVAREAGGEVDGVPAQRLPQRRARGHDRGLRGVVAQQEREPRDQQVVTRLMTVDDDDDDGG